jgi:hypothetical protein
VLLGLQQQLRLEHQSCHPIDKHAQQLNLAFSVGLEVAMLKRVGKKAVA